MCKNLTPGCGSDGPGDARNGWRSSYTGYPRELPGYPGYCSDQLQGRGLGPGTLKAGAIGYLLKNVSADELVNAIRAAHAGRPTLAPEAAHVLIQASQNHPVVGSDLTAREREILSLMVAGLSNPDIAEQLVVSRSTVKFHVSSILSKLGVSSRTQAVTLALQNKLV